MYAITDIYKIIKVFPKKMCLYTKPLKIPNELERRM